MTELFTFLVGVVFGWLVTWILQNRLNDDMKKANDLLQRDLDAAQREIASLEAKLANDKTALPVSDDDDNDDDNGEEADEEPKDVADRTLAAPVVTEAAAEEASVDEIAPLEEEAPTAEKTSAEEPAEEAVEEPAEEPAAEELTETDELVPGTDDVEPTTAGDEEISDFTKIRGIGPKFAEALQSGGIKNFTELAMATPEQLQEIVQSASWQKVDFEDWIAQANDILYK